MKKKLTLILVALSLSGLETHASTPSGSPSMQDRKAIEQTLTDYLKAFATNDFKLLEESCTSPFIKNNGGEAHLKKALTELKTKYQNASYSHLKFHQNNTQKNRGEIFVNFDIQGPNLLPQEKSGNWFRLKKLKNGKWKIAAIITDFDPTESQQ